MPKFNYKIIGYTTLGLCIVLGAFFVQDSSVFSKQKAESSAFGGYKLPDKTSQNSSMPTTVTWHEPYFLDKKK